MDADARGPVHGHPTGLAPVMERNIAALRDRRLCEDRRRSLEDRVADAISRFAGSMRFVYLHLARYSAWLVSNLGWTPLEPFDPSYVILAMEASVEAIFLSTFVLINQNRAAALADRRADLDLQISLLTELAKDVAPERVLDRIAESERAAGG